MRNNILFEDFTNLYKRWKNGNVRKEDKFNSNIDKMKCVDLSSSVKILFSDRDLIINGSNKFTFGEINSFMENINKQGWRLPTYQEIKKYFHKGEQPPKPNTDFRYEWIGKVCGEIYSPETNETLIFKTDNLYLERYWCDDEEDISRFENARGYSIGDPKDYYNCMVATNNYSKESSLKVRLVKNK